MQWFDVDRNGLAKLLEAKGKAFAVLELLQNAWDADGVTTVDISIEPVPNTPKVSLMIEDDSPVGFSNLSHAWTLFAESNRKGNAEKRGRYNLGEKLVLALCDSATISSTTGAVNFTHEGRSRGRTKRESGSCFAATMRMTRAEMDETIAVIKRVIPPDVATRLNGELLTQPTRLNSVRAVLQTEVADSDGVLRPTYRGTDVVIYEANGDGWLYEMGIPVVATGDRWHYDVQQKVPLNMNRDNVTAGYLRAVRAAVVDVMAEQLTDDDVKAPMVTTVMAELTPQAVQQVIVKRFGNDAVVYDPSDIEANKIAQSQGRQVIYGNAFTADAWDNIRKSGAVLPAGQVTPSPKPFSPDGSPLETIPPDEWTPEMVRAVAYIKRAGNAVLKNEPEVILTADRRWQFAACYGGGRLTLNVSRVDIGSRQAVNTIVIHEFAHEWVSDHLSADFHEKCCEIGAQLIEASLRYELYWGE